MSSRSTASAARRRWSSVRPVLLLRADGSAGVNFQAARFGPPGATRGRLGPGGDRRARPAVLGARTLSTGADLLTDQERQRISALFADEKHLDVEATRGVYQAMVAAYRDPDRARGKTTMTSLIAALSSGVPAALTELRHLGRTLMQRAADVLAYFDRPGTSNGPTEALNGRLEHLRGSALGFRNLTNYIARALLEAGGFRPRLHPEL